MKTLVYGGTGSQAKPTVLRLLERGHQPIVVTRKAENAVDLKVASATVVEADMADRESLLKLSEGVDAVAFLLPAFLGDGDDAAIFGKNAIYSAVAGGAKRFFWNASGPIYEDMAEPKYHILEYLIQSGLPYVVFEPTTYMENWLGPWTAPFVKKDNELSYPVLDHVKMGWLAYADVGKLVVSALENDTIKNKRFDISGIEAPTGPKLSKIYTQALGRNIKYRAMTPAQMGAAIDGAFGEGVGDRIAEMYRAEQEVPNPEPKYHDMTDVLEKFPVKMTTIEEWIGHSEQHLNRGRYEKARFNKTRIAGCWGHDRCCDRRWKFECSCGDGIARRH